VPKLKVRAVAPFALEDGGLAQPGGTYHVSEDWAAMHARALVIEGRGPGRPKKLSAPQDKRLRSKANK
jgi:hypothetical protein